MIIVSDVGRDGSIGDEDIHTLIIRVFNIEKLNKRYIIWLNRAEREATPQLSLLGFLSILKDDPQLPFELLPSWWKGNEAYAMVKRQLRSMSMYCRSAAS
jgi:DNA-binding transcriptional regulator PaaX